MAVVNIVTLFSKLNIELDSVAGLVTPDFLKTSSQFLTNF